jgi:hypothetical protein
VTEKEVVFVVRAVPPSERFPDGMPERRLAARYSPAELELMGALRKRYDAATSPRDAAAALNSIIVIHELKALADARLVETPSKAF